jgi:DNA-binding MarR family transcriptional regulator
MGDLSRSLGMPFSTATRTADWLVDNGYVQRLADPEDRRVVRVELTEAGKEAYRAMNSRLLEGAELFMHNFSLEERKELGRLLGKLVDNLEQYPDHTGRPDGQDLPGQHHGRAAAGDV